MLLLALLPVILRVAMLAQHPVPSPQVYDEFGHLLVADTLLHFRLANPPHPLHQFFETFFVLQTPTYASIYPLGQGLLLAIGRAIFGLPWVAVLLSSAALCALCYWMLRGWVTPEWALLGGILAVIEFGPLNPWMNSYWGGSLAACAGCLVFGALPRLRDSHRVRDGVLLGLGLGVHWLTRPYETVFLAIAALLFFVSVPHLRALAKPALAAALVLIPALGTVARAEQTNHRQLDYASLHAQPHSIRRAGLVHLATKSGPTSRTHARAAAPVQNANVVSRQRSAKPSQSYLLRLEYRVRFYRFFFLPALYIALPFFLARLRDWRFAWIALTLLLFALGVNFYPFFEVHYLARTHMPVFIGEYRGTAEAQRME